MSAPSRFELTRRALIGAGVATGVAAGIGVPLLGGLSSVTSPGRVLRSQRPLPQPFAQLFRTPATLLHTRSDDHSDYYDVVQKASMASILPGVKTPIWGYNGTFPGPTVETRRGRRVVIRHTNRLPVPTVVHLHGGSTPHDSDGYPTDFVYPIDGSYLAQHESMGQHMSHTAAGDTSEGVRDYIYPQDQRASMLWYHDHRMDFTGPAVWRGLAGMHIIRDEEEDELRLPSDRRELPVMITDRSFMADGALAYPSIDPTLTETAWVTEPFVAGVLGDVMLVNGVPWPIAAVDRATYRIRVLNACNARRLDLRLDGANKDALIQIGSDGGLLGAPLAHDHFELAPAQRVDLLIDFAEYAPGTRLILMNDFGDGNMMQVMCFVVGGAERAERFTVPNRLASFVPLHRSEAVVTRTFRFRSGDVNHTKGWLIDDRPFSPDSIAASPRLGTVEEWRFVADFHHPVHVHLSPFQVISRGIGGRGEFDAGWKDTIDLRPSEEAAVLIRFERYAGKYVFHCHNLEHEDMAMMANFVTH